MIIDLQTIIGRQNPDDPDTPYPAPRPVDPFPEPRRPAGPDQTPPPTTARAA